MSDAHVVSVLYTVDTEISAPYAPGWEERGLDHELERDVHGRTAAGDFGVGLQMDLLERHGLKGVFFVEALCADAAGREPLARTAGPIHARGHEVQLHLHTEWLARMGDASPLGGKTGQHVRHFEEDEQRRLLARGLENLEACGVPRPDAYRAGNYGADRATLRALAACGVRFDSSYNFAYLDSHCGLGSLGTLVAPREVDGLWEVPISFFRDGPGSVRHAQLCACSAAELEWLLGEAWRRRWPTVVIVSHSFELIRRPAAAGARARPRRLVAARFARLCRFLEAHRDRFATVGFRDLDPAAWTAPPDATVPASTRWRTLGRVAAQALGGLY